MSESKLSNVESSAGSVSSRKTVVIEVRGGVVVDVRGLPKGWAYHLVDRDVEDEGREPSEYEGLLPTEQQVREEEAFRAQEPEEE